MNQRASSSRAASRRAFLGASAAMLGAPLIAGAEPPQARRALEAGRLTKHDLATPALLLDL
ncbi:MAG TPA: hypothetical protein VGA39_00750, partial [Candidatus Acidoferrales bacterium]